MIYPEFDGKRIKKGLGTRLNEQRSKAIFKGLKSKQNKGKHKDRIDNMYYHMPYRDISILAFSCLTSLILKHFRGMLIPKELRIRERSGSSVSQKR